MANILVVDDEHLIVEMLSAYLGLMGHEAEGAFSSRQARDKLAYLEPDAILLDIMLPDMSGLDLCRELRADPATRHLPIIMISAYKPPRISEATEAGADGYLEKPVNLASLREALEGVNISSVSK